MNDNDYFRFILLLYLCNSKENIQLSRIFESIKTKNKFRIIAGTEEAEETSEEPSA